MTKTIDNIVDTIRQLKTQLDDAKAEKAQLDGRIVEQLSQLKALGLDSIEDATNEISLLSTQISELEQQLLDWLDTLEDKYGLIA